MKRNLLVSSTIASLAGLVIFALLLYSGFIWLQCKSGSLVGFVHDFAAFHGSGC